MSGRVFNYDTKGLRKLEKELDKLSRKAMPYAVRDGLNTLAFEARDAYVEQAKGSMTLRNKWTERGIRYTKAGGLNINSMKAVVGSVRDYMKSQEDGATETKAGKHGVPIPTAVAAGQAMGSKPRRRVIQRKNYMSAIQLAARGSGNRQKRNMTQIMAATKSGSGVAYLDLGRRKGLFRVHGTKRGLKIRMIYDLSRPSVTLKPNPMLENATKFAEVRRPTIFAHALKRQIRMHSAWK